MDDWKLIHDYADTGAEAAFTALVQRHINLVHSTALRRLNDTHAAQEVSQAVFCLLAEKVRTLDPKTSLVGWLYQTTCFKSSEYRRAAVRRFAREQEAAHMNPTSTTSEAASDVNWVQLAPILDDAMAHLSETDRLAILLRYFQNQPLREVGLALGLEEDAARKRVSRALDKLRDWFSQKGIAATPTGLAGLVSVHAVEAAPLPLAEAIVKAALLAGATVAGTVGSAGVAYAATLTLEGAIWTVSTISQVTDPTCS